MTTDGPRIARRMADIQPFHVMELLARARALEGAGRRIVHMEVGEPDFETPRPVVEAACAALAAGRTHYTPAAGIPELREAIAAHYGRCYGLEVEPERVLVTPGSSGALQLALSVLVDPGDQVLMTDPGYPCNRHFVRLVEGEAVAIAVGPRTRYQLSPELVAAHWGERTAAVLLGSPANPTGTLVPAEWLRAIGEHARGRSGALISDEIYHGLVYEGECPSALEVAPDAFVINGFSKYFGMTGWRIGWLIAPPACVREAEKLGQNIFLAASTPAQYAALACFQPQTLDELDARREQFRQRRDFLVPALRELGFGIPQTPQGAFYVYAECSQLAADSYEFCQRLLEEIGVAITPGLDFGGNQPQRHVRFSYTTSLEMLQEGVERLAKYLR